MGDIMKLIGYIDECGTPVITNLKKKDFEWLECAGLTLLWESTYKYGEWPTYEDCINYKNQT